MMQMRYATIALAVMLTGCSTAKAPPVPVEASRSYAMPYDEVWGRVVEVLASANIQIKTIEKESGVIYAEPAQANPAFADCGADIFSVTVARPATLNIVVRPADSGTVVTVNTSFRKVRSFDNTPYTAACHSTGLLETTILAAIAKSS